MASILIVDDQAYVRELFSKELADEGYEVSGVGDAQSVLAHIDNSKPDVVLLDLYLDGFEGWGVLRDIKRHDPNISVIIHTAYDSFSEDPRSPQADGYLIKSFTNLSRLKQTIGEVIEKKEL